MVAAAVTVGLTVSAATLGSATRPHAGAGAAPDADAGAIAAKLASVPPGVFHAVGAGSAVAFPLAVDAPTLTSDGKPAILYMGAEYCPYCATERWAIVAALSRFGRFTNLHMTHSSTDDTYPNTATFTFHGAGYESGELAFDAVELATNRPDGHGSYTALDLPTAEQRRLMTTYSGPPYFAPSSTGGIPFVDLGGRYLVSGASYDPAVLQGRTASEIARAVVDASDAIAKGVIGAANALTTAICGLTGNRPATVCDDPAITALAPRLR